jgi:hypothetical protein
MTLLTMLPRLRTNNLKGLGATLTMNRSHNNAEPYALALWHCKHYGLIHSDQLDIIFEKVSHHAHEVRT